MGEIYCFSGDYLIQRTSLFCKECRDFCGEIPKALESYYNWEEKDKEKVFINLANHMKTQHPDIIVKKIEGGD